MKKYGLDAIAIGLALPISLCANGEQANNTPDTILEEILVTGGAEAIGTMAGSAHLLDEDQLEQFDFSDINQVLSSLPGVYIRQEDGYGLRPNIGLRGVTSERSQKITLMEDGLLITPAPYSAPAAYYIPNISRMSAVEVVKGPGTVKFGPNNVGGAINLVTQPIPESARGFLDISAGSDRYRKYQVFYGNSNDYFGYWIDALNYGSDGFKELDNGGDTGFERNDFNTKLQWRNDDLWGYPQQLTIKLGYADELADETYLGVTEADFKATPDRRYAASQLARFESEHSQIHIEHLITLTNNLDFSTKAYVNHFDRAWRKLDGFIDGVPVATVLERPELFTRELGILRGEIDSNGTASETIDITTNDRSYESQGVQLKATYNWETGNASHTIESGLRIHQDIIERDHHTEGYLMLSGLLVNDGLEWGNKTLNQAETDAIAFFIHDTISWQKFTISLGLRHETIDATAEDFLTDSTTQHSQSMTAPGAGIFWQLSESFGVLLGVNKGFSPAGASAEEDTNPEEAVNYEYGFRYSGDNGNFEAIGFFSDYSNLLGRCRASDSGCSVGQEFNGGSVEVAGVELFGQYLLADLAGFELPISLSYTFTESAFQDSFSSSFSQWGEVEVGDELPYLPKHTGRLQLGLARNSLSMNLAANFQSEMRNVAGNGSITDGLHAEAQTTYDISGTWIPNNQWLVQISVDNLTNDRAIVSWRPFGARPNKPRTLRARVKYSF